MSSNMCTHEILSASIISPTGDMNKLMTPIKDRTSCQTLYSSTQDSSCEESTVISNEAKQIEMPEPDKTVVCICTCRQKCPLKPHSATTACEISTRQQLVTRLQNQSNRFCLRQITKGLSVDQNNNNDSIKINCDSKQNNNNDIEGEEVLEMSTICRNRNKGRQRSSTIWNYDNCYHTCSFNNNNNNIDYENGGQNEKRSHSNSLKLFSTSTTSLRSNECSTQTKTIVHRHVTSNFVALAMKNLLATLLSVSVMNKKLFVNSSLLVLLCISMIMNSAMVSASPIASAGPGPLGVGSGSSLQLGGGLPFPEGKTR